MARDISISSYTYELPDDRIAQFPLGDRASSKLLRYKDGKIHDYIFSQLPDLLPENVTLIFNTTKVVCARILFSVEGAQKPIEIFVLEPQSNMTMEQAMLQKGRAVWKCLVGNNKSFRADAIKKEIQWHGEQHVLQVNKPQLSGDVFLVEFIWSESLTFSEMLDAAGQIPLPPYMKRGPEQEDSSRYQTVYANEEGSVAAPTAGLHFTDAVINELRRKNIQIEHVTLHVGAGTFRPVKAATMATHDMHAEEISISKETLKHLVNNPDSLIAVGTTSLRTLESLFWIGWKWLHAEQENVPMVNQWDAYDADVPVGFTFVDALHAIISRMEIFGITTITTKTQLLIAPGYTIRTAKALITNFHQPNSTLLLLVATFVGADWKLIYNHAHENEYRFLSYGDSSLLWRK